MHLEQSRDSFLSLESLIKLINLRVTIVRKHLRVLTLRQPIDGSSLDYWIVIDDSLTWLLIFMLRATVEDICINKHRKKISQRSKNEFFDPVHFMVFSNSG